jgi:hypothetical protein
MKVNAKKQTYAKGDKFYILKGVIHPGKVYSRYASIAFLMKKNVIKQNKNIVNIQQFFLPKYFYLALYYTFKN